MSTYAITTQPAPLYNTPNFPHLQPKLEKDTQGLLKSIEIIALPSTKLTVLKTTNNISEVTSTDYPSPTPLYIDNRFLQEVPHQTPERKRTLPSPTHILQFFTSVIGVRYFWGGNWAQGIPEMPHLYPQLTAPEDQDDVLCKGVDCSGLLYQATNGFTPRNTTQLCTYGQELEVDSLRAVQQVVKPLDMLVWPGHVLFVLDTEHFIESLIGHGVIISNLAERYQFLRDKLRTENKPFSLRRWHPHFI